MIRVRRDSSALLVVDVQERLLPVIDGHEEIERRIGVAVAAATILGVPIVATEQYPRGLGPTVASISTQLTGPVIEKISFSCCGVAPVDRALAALCPATLVVVGIETHVCVLQTCLDLIERNITPVVLADGVGSRHARDYDFALERLRAAGALVTTLEAVLFELTGTAGTDEFRQISKLVKPL